MGGAIRLSIASVSFLALAACSTQQGDIAQTEYMLARSGFTVRPAGTPEQTAEVVGPPANQFVTRLASDGQTEYVYSDPVHCNCTYVGNRGSYHAFLQAMNAAATGLV